jgi:glycosyltransferase involved in cell wall biosynthesis
LKVLLVSNRAETAGGGEVSLLLLMEGLLASGTVRPVLAVPAGGEVEERAREMGGEVIRLPLPGVRFRPWSLPRVSRRTAGIIGTAAPDMVHINGARAMLLAGRAARRMSLPILWHVRVEGRDPLDRFLACSSTLIVTPSRTVAERFPDRDVRIVPNPVPLKNLDRDAPAVKELREELCGGAEMLLLSVGELSPQKNHHRLIEALAGLGDLPDWRLVIAGRENPDRPGFRASLEQAVEKNGLSHRIRFLGFREDVTELMLASDLLLHTPDTEGFGRVLVEAMAAGLPLVSTPAGGPSELHAATGYGWLAGDFSPESLGRVITAAVGDEETRRECRRRGPELASSRFSVAAHTAAITALYTELVERRDTDADRS